LWLKTEEELAEIGLPPPFWAFAWAGGQGLARHVLDHPEIVRGRDVLDFASGSGLLAIAAVKAGAKSVVAADIDPFSATAVAMNAAENAVVLDHSCADLIGRDHGWDVVLAGDVFYDRALAEQLTPWFGALARRGAAVLIGDPGRSYLPRQRLEPLAVYQVAVTRVLEDAEVKRTTVWRVA
jgi:predicted nicotinamide N-methyase